MIFHVVLFRPRPDLTDTERGAFVDALERAASQIPQVRRFSVGHRVTHGRGYEAAMPQDFEYAAVVEFDDLAGLKAYLDHPAHAELGDRFSSSLAAGLVYDYEMREDGIVKSPLL
ncbi:MAG: Dabb family protein [Acidobacteria bacterium]|nr:Dabb family protein [Acidobacteriota bacterium]